MEISHIIFARTQGMVLLDGGKPKKIGGVADAVECEFENGDIAEVICIFFNLVKGHDSTDFFLFSKEDEKLISYSLGTQTDPFFIKMYEGVLLKPQNHELTSFMHEFIGEYVAEGLYGNSSLF